MPPQTEEHKRKIKESNIKTWSNPILKKKHSCLTKKKIKEMDPKKRKLQLKRLAEKSRTPEKREISRQTMNKLRSDPDFEKKRKKAQKEIDRNGKNNYFYGKKHTKETRYKISKTKKESEKTPRGKDNKAFIDGLGKERKQKRITFQETIEYKLFREAIFKRDKYKCTNCGSIKKLEIHHIKSYKNNPKLRTVLSNGCILCKECHKKTNNYGRKNKIV